MRTNDFLDAVKARHKLVSDYKLAKFLGWRPQRVSEYRHTARELDDEACVQIAAALELPPAYVLACIAEQRAKSDSVKNYWREAARLLKTGAAAGIVVAALLASHNARSFEPVQPSALTQPAIHYAQRRRRRDAWRPR